jgi:hypothetical protein
VLGAELNDKDEDESEAENDIDDIIRIHSSYSWVFIERH